MKLARFSVGSNSPVLGAITADGASVVDLQAASGDATRFPASTSAFLARGAAGIADAQSVIDSAPASSIYALSDVKLLAPVGDPGKIMCIGQNYRDHCEEQNQPIPEKAILFSKYATALNDPNADVPLLKISTHIDYEAELAVVIGGPAGGARDIPEADALNYVAGYVCANDITARDIQKGDGQWVRGKSPDKFFPIGPFLVTADEIADPHNLDISLTLNGNTMQKSNTLNLIFRIPYLIAYLSQTMTLLPGDILSTGTPGGVGVFRNPPIFLQAGDTVSVTIAGLGTLTNHIVAP